MGKPCPEDNHPDMLGRPENSVSSNSTLGIHAYKTTTKKDQCMHKYTLFMRVKDWKKNPSHQKIVKGNTGDDNF